MRNAQPPLQGPALDTATLSFQVVAGNEAAWVFAAQTGAYEQLVRCMDAYPNDPEVQSLCCDALACLGNARGDSSSRETWAAHPDKAARTGAIRAMAAALHAHGAHRDVLISAAATLASIFARSLQQEKPAEALAVARDGRAADALAGALPLALRIAATDDAELLEILLDVLSSLARLDTVCAQQAARPGTLAVLGEALRLHGGGTSGFAYYACSVMRCIVEVVPLRERSDAADGCIAGLRVALVAHRVPPVQSAAWDCVYVLTVKDERAARRADAGIAADAVRMLQCTSADVDANDSTIEAATCASRALSVLVNADNRSRCSAVAAGIVPVLTALLRAHGSAHEQLASGACTALVPVFKMPVPGDDPLELVSGSEDILSLVAVLATTMLAHAASMDVQLSATAVLLSLMVSLLYAFELEATMRRPARDASGLARRLADAGVLEATATALQMHAGADPVQLRDNALVVLIVACSGAMLDSTSPPLQASVAARAAQAGVGAALSAALAQNLRPHPDSDARTRAAALAAAVARLPVPRVCDSCGTTDASKLKLCSRCLKVRFCGEACQRAAWPEHKLVCVRAPAADAT